MDTGERYSSTWTHLYQLWRYMQRPQSDVDATHDDHYAEDANFDDDAYVGHGDGSDDIDVSSFVDLLHGEPGDNQKQQVKF